FAVDCSELLEPNLAMYRTLNEFFFRKLRPSARPIASPSDPTVISSSADCRLTVYSDVESAQEFWIKGRNFSLVDLLQDDDMANYFEGGEIACFRLAPKDYHRYHSPVDAVVGPTKFIHGEYLTVNPTVVNNASLDVFTTNKRDGEPSTDGPPTIVAFVQIGAMLVGSIRQTARQGAQVQRGDELGYFGESRKRADHTSVLHSSNRAYSVALLAAYGGSTIVAVFPRRSVRWDQDLLTNSKVPVETLVKVSGLFLYDRAVKSKPSSAYNNLFHRAGWREDWRLAVREGEFLTAGEAMVGVEVHYRCVLLHDLEEGRRIVEMRSWIGLGPAGAETNLTSAPNAICPSSFCW
ncbi:phosphatidylserine decarboxylase-domain-containing protein, partial [Leucosporidium creatinivorum]